MFRALGRGLGKIPGVGFITRTIGNIGSYFTNLRRVFSGVDSTMRTASGQFRKMNFFEKGIKSIGAFFRSVGGMFSGFSGGGFMEKMKPLSDFFAKFKPMFGKLLGISLHRLVMKLFIVLLLLYGLKNAYDFIHLKLVKKNGRIVIIFVARLKSDYDR